MTARRTIVLAALTVLAGALPTGAAHAAGVAQITSPAADAAVAQSTAIVVEVTGDTQRTSLFEPPPPHQVQVRLATPSGAEMMAGTSPVTMGCETDCHTTSTWTAPHLDPATLSPFADAPSCNGGYTIQVRVDGGAWTGHGIRVGRPPAAPRDVGVTADVGEATVSWAAASDPDAVGYRVQRRLDDGSWTTLVTSAASTRSFTDTDVDPGAVEYRVATLKGDGRVDGAPVAPCADTEPDLSTASAPAATTVPSAAGAASPSPRPSPSDPSRPSRPSPTPSSEPGDDGSEEATDSPDGTDGDSTADDPDDAATGDQGDDPDADNDAGATAPRRAGTRVAPPTPVTAGSRSEVTVADVPGADSPQVATERESYYGDGEEFSEELAYDGLGGVEATGPVTKTRVVRVPGALQTVLGEELDLRRLAPPIAAGLILVAFALHLRRWMRDGMEP